MIRKIDEQEEVTVYNKSGQLISLQLSDVGADFYQQQQAHLMANKTMTIPTKYLNINQINNLLMKGFLLLVASK